MTASCARCAQSGAHKAAQKAGIDPIATVVVLSACELRYSGGNVLETVPCVTRVLETCGVDPPKRMRRPGQDCGVSDCEGKAVANACPPSLPENEAGGSHRKSEAIATLLLVGLLAVGVGLRLVQYLHNRALWMDEAALALNIIDKSPRELLGPLDYVQNSPIGFLLCSKFITLGFGTSEYALRFLPLLSGIVSVFLFWALARRMARTGDSSRWEVALIGLAFFAVGKHLLYYSSELRHYSTDVALVCLLFLLAVSDRPFQEQERESWWRNVALILAGVAATWLSLASIFILAAIGATQIMFCGLRKEWRKVAWVAAACAVWAVSFYVHLHMHQTNISLRGLGEEIYVGNTMSFMPFPPSSLADLKWFRETFERMFYFPAGLTYRGLGGFALLVGCISLWRRKKPYLFLLTLPFFFALIASGLHRYPFRDRFILFLAPCMLLLIAEGIGFLMNKTTGKTRLIGALLLVMLLTQPVAHGLRVIALPRSGYEIKPLLEHMKAHWQEGDAAYVAFSEVHPFLYYQPRFGFQEGDFELEPRDVVLAGTASEHRAQRVAELLEHNQRVWILFGYDTAPPLAIAPGQVDGIGKQLKAVSAEGATVFLYERAEPAP